MFSFNIIAAQSKLQFNKTDQLSRGAQLCGVRHMSVESWQNIPNASKVRSKAKAQKSRNKNTASPKAMGRSFGLSQWFPTGVPRHPGVPFTVPRGAAG